jgi:cytidylate kinase
VNDEGAGAGGGAGGAGEDGAGEPLVVTISSTYGAGGSLVGPELARRLGLPYLDRVLVPSQLAGTRPDEGLAPDEHGDSVLSRLLAGAARMPVLIGVNMPPPDVALGDEERFRAQNEAAMRHLVETTGGVIRGRGGAAFLGADPHCFHVRLDGPLDARLRQAMAIEAIDEEEARRRQADTDRTRALYVKRFYDRDVHDPALYHLVLDSTRIPLPACAELIEAAARAAKGALPPGGAGEAGSAG